MVARNNQNTLGEQHIVVALVGIPGAGPGCKDTAVRERPGKLDAGYNKPGWCPSEAALDASHVGEPGILCGHMRSREW